jgi:alpha-amylase
LGNFIDNHDNDRTLHLDEDWGDKVKHYKAAHVFILTSVGIPIVYYGAEQLFAGGTDPKNR